MNVFCKDLEYLAASGKRHMTNTIRPWLSIQQWVSVRWGSDALRVLGQQTCATLTRLHLIFGSDMPRRAAVWTLVLPEVPKQSSVQQVSLGWCVRSCEGPYLSRPSSQITEHSYSCFYGASRDTGSTKIMKIFLLSFLEMTSIVGRKYGFSGPLTPRFQIRIEITCRISRQCKDKG